MIRITTKQFEKYKRWILHIGKFRFSAKVWWQKEYDNCTGIFYTNYKKKQQWWEWRELQCIWVMNIEIRNLKIYCCRFVNDPNYQ